MSLLEQILAEKRAEIRAAKSRVPEAALLQEAHGERRDFLGALRRPGLSVIAEIKRASPSRGPLRPNLDPPSLARDYERGGAAAISVLTERLFFQGSLDDLRAVREATSLPLLRKDFIIDPYQIAEAAAVGADAILLIAACLTRTGLQELLAAAGELGLAALVEVHDEDELALAVELGAPAIGVNNRNLHTFTVDLAVGLRLLPIIPKTIVRVAESGIRGLAEAMELRKAGAEAVLVGESLIMGGDPAALIRKLREGRVCSSRSAD